MGELARYRAALEAGDQAVIDQITAKFDPSKPEGDVYKRQEEGAEIVLTNTAVSIRMGTIGRLAEKCNTIVVPADATSVEDLENLIDKTMEHFGGKFDFMLHSIGMSPNVRKGRTYDDLDYDYLSKTCLLYTSRCV